MWPAYTVVRQISTAASCQALSFSPDGHFVLTGSRDHSARLFTAKDLRPLYTLLGHTGTVHSVGFSADHRYLFTAAADSTVRRWVFPYPLAETVEQRSSNQIIATRYSPDGRYPLQPGWPLPATARMAATC